MIPKVIEAKALTNFRLQLTFDDGRSGTVDLSEELWGPMFEPLRNEELFRQVTVDPELQTVVWPNGADLAPEFLYDKAIQQAVVADNR